jgi:hypothetical protein
MQKAATVLDNDGFLSPDSRCELRTIRDYGHASAERLRKFVLIVSRVRGRIFRNAQLQAARFSATWVLAMG